MENLYQLRIEAIVDCACEWAKGPGTAEQCAAQIRSRLGELGIDTAGLEAARSRLAATKVEPDFCRAVAAAL